MQSKNPTFADFYVSIQTTRKQFWSRYCQFSKIMVKQRNPINKLLQRDVFPEKGENRKGEIFNPNESIWIPSLVFRDEQLSLGLHIQVSRKMSPNTMLKIDIRNTIQCFPSSVQRYRRVQYKSSFAFWPWYAHVQISLYILLASGLKSHTSFANKS